MGEPSIAYLVYRILDDVQGHIVGFDDSWRALTLLVSALPARGQSPHFSSHFPIDARFYFRVTPIPFTPDCH